MFKLRSTKKKSRNIKKVLELRQRLTYKDILFSCLLEEKTDNSEIFEFIKNVFAITEKEDEKLVEKVKKKLKSYKYENIVDHSLLLTAITMYDLENSEPACYSKLEPHQPQISTVIGAHARFKHLSETEKAFSQWNSLNEVSSHYSLHPGIFRELIGSVTEVDQETGSYQLKTEIAEFAEDFWKQSENFMNSCLSFVEKLPAEESQEAEHNESMLIIFFDAVNKLQNCNPPAGNLLVSKNFAKLISESLVLGVKKHLTYDGDERLFTKEQKVSKITDIVARTSQQFQNFLVKHENSFKL